MNKITKLYSLALILVIMLNSVFFSCEKDSGIENNKVVKIIYSNDSIENVKESVLLNDTGIGLSFYQDHQDSVYYFYINSPSDMVDRNDFRAWGIQVYIPKESMKMEGVYELGLFLEDSWIELDQYFLQNTNGLDEMRYVRYYKSYNTNHISGSFELYNLNDSTVDIKFNNIKLYYLPELFATADCDLTIRHKGIFFRE